MKSWSWKIGARLKEVLGGKDKDVLCLNLLDHFSYRDPDLIRLIKERYETLWKRGEHERR
jgi:predicted protein tyrosine phosphatase